MRFVTFEVHQCGSNLDLFIICEDMKILLSLQVAASPACGRGDGYRPTTRNNRPFAILKVQGMVYIGIFLTGLRVLLLSNCKAAQMGTYRWR